MMKQEGLRMMMQMSREPDTAASKAERSRKHDFTVEQIESSFGGPREFLSRCARCKWTFHVNPDRGSIVACDSSGAPLTEPEASQRVDTFAEGPCPAIDDSPHDWEDAAEDTYTHPGFLERLQPVLHALGFHRVH